MPLFYQSIHSKMSKATVKWSERRKNLPKNWCEEISKALSDKGLNVSAEKVSDLRRGKIKDLELVTAVWSEIRKLEKRHSLVKKKLTEIMST